MATLVIELDGLTLPDQTTLEETTGRTEVSNRTLDNTLTVDYAGNPFRTWVVSWANLSRTYFDAIMAKYEVQYDETRFLTFVVEVQEIDTYVKMSVSTKNIRWNGDRVADFSVTLEETLAIS